MYRPPPIQLATVVSSQQQPSMLCAVNTSVNGIDFN